MLVWGVFRATPPKELFEQSDKVAHLIAFAGLSFTGRMAMPAANGVLYWFVMVGLAVALEYLQGLVQITRLSSIEDAVANIAGIGFGLLLVALVRGVVKVIGHESSVGGKS